MTPQELQHIRELVGNPKHYLVVAGNYFDFLSWCQRNSVIPDFMAKGELPDAVFVNNPESLEGRIPGDCFIVYSGNYRINPIYGTHELNHFEKLIDEAKKPKNNLSTWWVWLIIIQFVNKIWQKASKLKS